MSARHAVHSIFPPQGKRPCARQIAVRKAKIVNSRGWEHAQGFMQVTSFEDNISANNQMNNCT